MGLSRQRVVWVREFLPKNRETSSMLQKTKGNLGDRVVHMVEEEAATDAIFPKTSYLATMGRGEKKSAQCT